MTESNNGPEDLKTPDTQLPDGYKTPKNALRVLCGCIYKTPKTKG